MSLMRTLSITGGQILDRRIYRLWLSLLFLLFTIPAVAQTDVHNIDIGVVTYGPAAGMMSRFGHTAIVLIDADGNKVFYELAAGYSADTGFQLPWYLTPGPLIYIAQQKNRKSALHSAFEKRRSVDIRVLNLNTQQKQHFALLLADAIDEKKALFEFGLYTNNCTTRLRNMLDTVLDGQLAPQFQSSPARMSYRQYTQTSFTYQPVLLLAADLFTGRPADDVDSAWDGAAFPITLARLLDQAKVTGEDGTSQPLVKTHYPLFNDALVKPVSAEPLALGHWFLICGLLLASGLLLRSRIDNSQAINAPITAWLYINGSIGLFIAYLWFIGGEPVTGWNENILLFNPLCLSLVMTRSKRWQYLTGIGLLACLIVALVLKVFPGAQDNWNWIGLTLPIHGVVLYQWFVVGHIKAIKCPYCRSNSKPFTLAELRHILHKLKPLHAQH